MNTRSILSLGVCMVLTRTALAGQPNPGSWETTFSAGYDGIGRHTMLDTETASLTDIGTLDPTLGDHPANLGLDHLSFHDVLHPGMQFALESGYWATPNFEPFLRFDYTQLRGRTTDIGSITSPALTSPAVIGADFANRGEQSLSLGSRYLFNSSGALRPYVTGFFGWTHQDKLHADLEAPELGLASEPAVLLHANTLFDAGVEAGLSYGISDNADVRVSAGLDYLEGNKTTTAAFERFGFGPVTLGAQHWTVPINLGMSYRF